MNHTELAKAKLDRAIKMIEHFDEMNENDLRSFLLCLLRSMDAMPNQNNEKMYWYAKINSLLNMELNKYGAIFKAANWKNSVIVKKQDMENMVWNVNSLMY